MAVKNASFTPSVLELPCPLDVSGVRREHFLTRLAPSARNEPEVHGTDRDLVRSHLNFVHVPAEGFEPPTLSSVVRCAIHCATRA